jgi:hypothetical protein
VGGLAATVVALGGNFLGVTSALLGRPLLPTHTLAPPWVSAADMEVGLPLLRHCDSWGLG